MNARFRHLRIATLCSIFLALIFTGILAALSPQASIAQRGNTANALALNAALGAKSGKAITPSRYLAPASLLAAGSQTVNPAVGPTTVSLPEPVQTFDVFAPAPSFTVQGDPLNYANRFPNWSSDESYIVFASTRPSTVAGDPANRSHLWAVSSDGGAPTQLTSGTGNEFYPVLSPSTSLLAFTSNAKSPTTQNLFYIPFNPNAAPVSVNNLTSLTIRPDINTGLNGVGRPAWSPSEDRLAFTAMTTVGASQGHTHVYLLYVQSGGYQPFGSQGDNPPGRLTSGVDDEADVAWSPDGRFLVYTSNASGFQNTGFGVNPNPNIPAQETTPAVATGVNALSVTNLFALTSDGLVPANIGNGALTTDGTSGGAAWAFNGSTRAGSLAYHHKVVNLNAAGTHYDIFFYQAENGLAISKENGSATQLNTDDSANRNNTYPTWSPQQKHLSIAYASDRSVTYNNPSNGTPLETAQSVLPGTFYVGANYTGILESEVENINPPVLLRFNDTNTEIVHVNAGNAFVQTAPGNLSGSATRSITPGTDVTFTVRLSSREAGVDPNNVYIQIKDPDSKAQDSQNLEHKVFTHDTTFPLADSGSEEDALHNLAITDPTFLLGRFWPIRGAIGGWLHDTVYLGVGQTGGGTNPQPVIAGSPNRPSAPGDNPNLFKTWGQEFECEFVNAQFATPTKTDTDPLTDYGAPFFLAGVDDRGTHSAPIARPEWLRLARVTSSALQDTKGGALYSATWKTPTSASDYYLDVIAYDKSQNWRIFDNVWGFTTQTFTGDKSILIVNDNGLGQKFIGSTFGSNGAQNLRPTFYGSESYYTEVDPALLPNAVHIEDKMIGYPGRPGTLQDGTGAGPTGVGVFPRYIGNSRTPSLDIIWAGTTPPSDSYRVRVGTSVGAGNLVDTIVGGNTRLFTFQNNNVDLDPIIGRTYFIRITGTVGTTGTDTDITYTVPPPSDLGYVAPITVPLGGPHGELPTVVNALGNNAIGGGALANKHQYNLWRILSRGPVRDDILLAYAAKKETQPDVSDGNLVNPAGDIPVAKRCVIWTAPYAGQLFVGAGSIASPETQTQLTNYIAEGGRLFLSGGHIASALTADGTQGSSFLSSVLGADYVGSRSDIQAFVQSTANTSRITFDPHFNFFGNVNVMPYRVFQDGGGITLWEAPASMPMKLAGDILGNNVPSPDWRTDASLGQFGPFPAQIGPSTGLQFLGSIDVVTPLGGFQQDVTYPSGGGGLQYGVDPAAGSKTIFASFGLEGVGTEYYTRTFNGVTYYFPYNLRPKLMHNIVTYLRTASFSGTIRDAANGGGTVSGATVYLTSADGNPIPNLPPGRTVYSALTNGVGKYTINGVEPGAYIVHAYKNQSHAVSFTADYVTALDTFPVDLNLQKEADGSLNGHVTNLDGTPANNATLTFTAPDGTIVTTQTNNTGFYSVQNVPSAPGVGLAYTGFASKIVSPFTFKSDTKNLIVVSGQATTTDFVLLPPPGRITGTVTDFVTHLPLPGATITITSAGLATPITLTTNAQGVYTTGLLPPATYDMTATKSPDYVTQLLPGKVVGFAQTLTVNIALVPVKPGRMVGVVTDSRGVPVEGATVALTPATPALTATTDYLGRYVINNVPAATEPGKAYYATAAKGSRKTAQVRVLFTSVSTVTQNFQLPEAPGVFSGTVTDAATGAKLAGATLTFTPKAGGTPRIVATNANGQYTTGGIHAETYNLKVTFPPSYQQQTFLDLVLPQDVTVTKDIALNMTRGGRIAGTVTDSRGVVVPFATVTFKPVSGGLTVTTTTNSSGQYSVSSVQSAVAPGKAYNGSAQSGTRVSPTATVIVMDGGATAQDFQLPEAAGSFIGNVTDAATGAKLQGVNITFTPRTAGKPVKSLRTDANGHYYTGPMFADTYTITLAFAPNYQPQKVVIALPQDAVVTKDFQMSTTELGVLSGAVTSPDGVPVPGATVRFASGAGAVLLATTDASGKYTIANVRSATDPGLSYTGAASKSGVFSASATVLVTNGAKITQNFTLQPPPGTFVGTVTDAATGKPLPNVTLTFTPLQGSDRTPVTATSDALGKYTSGAMKFGKYKITAVHAPKYATITLNSVYLADSGNTTQDFQMTPTPNGNIGGLVTFGGIPATTLVVGGATITLTPDDGLPAITITTGATAVAGANGSVNFQRSVPPGTYTVSVEKTGYLNPSAPKTVTVTSAGFTRADMSFDPIKTFAAGTQMISAPYDYSGTSLNNILGVGKSEGAAPLAIWQPGSLNYAVSPTAPADTLHLGLGYWTKLTGTTSVYFAGPAPTTPVIHVALQPFWNQIGVPSVTAINVSDLTFSTADEQDLTFAQASAPDRHIVDSTIYGYDGAAYTPITAGGTLEPWQGYWIKVYKATTISLPTNSGSVSNILKRK
ncbi:MAG: carboxypeptidase regulatory-like domain-containing protein [Capsulimonas sp.]|uniref:carboxypeptidase regulatory-like domain-containing protein n=1 Tax=Capsulimonas sp. TaxID=2494211 RepID=UPI0032672FE5